MQPSEKQIQQKDSSFVRWKCQDFQWIFTKRHTKIGSYFSTGSYSIVLRFRTHQVCFTANIEKDLPADSGTSTRQGSTKISMEILMWRTHRSVKYHHCNIWNLFSSIFCNTLPKEVSRWHKVSIPKGCSSAEQWLLCWWITKRHLKQRRCNQGASCFKQQDLHWGSGLQTILHSWLTFQRSCKKHNRHYPWIMNTELQSSDYNGIQQTISFKTRATPPRCNKQTPQRAENEGCWSLEHKYFIPSDCLHLSLPTRYFYRNCGKTNYIWMN